MFSEFWELLLTPDLLKESSHYTGRYTGIQHSENNSMMPFVSQGLQMG